MSCSLFAQRQDAHDNAIWTVKWATLKDGTEVVVTGSADSTVKVWQFVEDGGMVNTDLKVAHTFDDFTLTVVSIDTVATPEGTFMAASSMDGYIRVYSLDDNTLQSEIDAGTSECWDLSFDPTGKLLASGGCKGCAYIWNWRNPSDKRVYKPSSGSSNTLHTGKPRFVMSTEFSNDGSRVAVGYHGPNPAIDIYEVESGALLMSMKGAFRSVRSIAWGHATSDHPWGRYLVAGSQDQRVHIWDVADKGKETAQLAGHRSWVTGIAFSPEKGSGLCASVSTDHKLKVWDLATKNADFTHKTHSDQVWAVAYNSTGRRLATVGNDARLCVYTVLPKSSQ